MYYSNTKKKAKDKSIFSMSKVLDGIYHLSFDSTINLGAYFLRYQEYYESPRYYNVPFQLIDFLKWYASENDGNFTYFSDWAGFNLPAQVILDLYPQLTDANDHDSFMLLIAKMVLKENDKAYIIGTSHESKSALDHEIAHGLFYTNTKYQAEMKRTVKKLPAKIRKGIESVLLEMGYHERVLVDEIQAYMATGVSDRMKVPSKYQGPFRKVFYKYYQPMPA